MWKHTFCSLLTEASSLLGNSHTVHVDPQSNWCISFTLTNLDFCTKNLMREMRNEEAFLPVNCVRRIFYFKNMQCGTSFLETLSPSSEPRLNLKSKGGALFIMSWSYYLFLLNLVENKPFSRLWTYILVKYLSELVLNILPCLRKGLTDSPKLFFLCQYHSPVKASRRHWRTLAYQHIDM